MRKHLISMPSYLYLLDPDPFTHVKKSEGGSDDIDLSFLKELEQQDEAAAAAAAKKH